MLNPITRATFIALSNGLPTHEMVRQHLRQILSSKNFDASSRNRRFLEFVVDETISGHGDRLKGYTIAVEVFNREPSFDPQLDPVVRIEAGHLRRSLERYYLTEGRVSPVVIVIPKGTYVPKFELRQLHKKSQIQDPARAPSNDHISLFVEPILNQEESVRDVTFNSALTEEIIIEFYKKYREIEIFVSKVDNNDNRQLDINKNSSNPKYILRGNVRRSDADIRIIFRLLEVRTGQIVWIDSFNEKINSIDMIKTPRRFAVEIADSVSVVVLQEFI